MTSCMKCGSNRIETRALKQNELLELGIAVRVSRGAAVNQCLDCGREDVVIESMGELLNMAAYSLTLVPYKLNGSEIRCCRKAIGLSGKKLAAMLSVQPETLSRWENDKQPMDDVRETNFRMRVAHFLRDKVHLFDPHAIDTILSLKFSPVREEDEVPVLTYGVVDSSKDESSDTQAPRANSQAYKIAKAVGC